MRGSDTVCGALFSYVDLQKRVRPGHPLRVLGGIANDALVVRVRPGLCAGRPRVDPAGAAQRVSCSKRYSIWFKRPLVERIEFDLLFRWFVGLGVDDPVRDATTFTKNRDRLLAGKVAVRFLAAVVARSRVRRLVSSEHFSVDGTLTEAWVSPKNFQPKNWVRQPTRPGPQR